jgi:hypothetical protein
MNSSGESTTLADRSNSSVDGRPLEERAIEASINAAEKEVEQMKEKSRQFRVESERLRHESRKLMEESDRLEAEERAVQQKVASEEERIVNLYFEGDLHRLRRNDLKSMDTVHYPTPFGYGRALGPALLVNTVLVELFLNVQLLLPRGIREIPAAYVDPILQFVSKSTSLRHVYLCESKMFGGYDTTVERLTSMLVEAMVHNSCIETLALDLRKPVVPLLRIASAGMKLTTLTIWISDIGDDFILPSEYDTIGVCIASLPMLERLDLTVIENTSLSACILNGLTKMNTRLRHLELTASNEMDHDYSTALSRFLGNTATLSHLEMTYLEFSNDNVQDLLDGLQHVDALSGAVSVHLSKLVFSQCEIYDWAFDLMANFLQTKTEDANGTVICQSALRELHFEGFDPNRLSPSLSAQLADSLLMVVPQATDRNGGMQMLPTIGSLIQSVSLVRPNGIFLQRLGENSYRVRLETLRLKGISLKFCKTLARCMPRLVSLRTLSVAAVRAGGAPWILCGLKKSGQLHSLESADADIFDATQMRLIEAYCQRNRVLVEWLEKVSEQSDQSNDDAQPPTTLQLSSFPTLLEVAKQVPIQRATFLLRGLLGFEPLETAALSGVHSL